MRLLAAKREEKRLDRAVQSGLDQTKIPIKLTATINNGVQSGREVPKARRNRPQKLDRRTKWRHMSRTAFYLGNVG
jgi:hypothetical protein